MEGQLCVLFGSFRLPICMMRVSAFSLATATGISLISTAMHVRTRSTTITYCGTSSAHNTSQASLQSHGAVNKRDDDVQYSPHVLQD
jgi:hypothetical protein